MRHNEVSPFDGRIASRISAILEKAFEYLRADLDRVEAAIATQLRFSKPLMGEVGRYLADSKGKRLRPMLALLAARMFGVREFADSHTRVAGALEMVHLATLLHDDVIDKATTRRGKPSVNAKWGDDVAILMADHLFSAAFPLILDEAGRPAVRALTEATCLMCEGEMFQIEKRDQLLTVEDYLFIIRCKTARLFGACAEIGAFLAGATDGPASAMREFGLNFGMAFQITDDLLDYTARGAKWGKQVGTDISNGKQTLPFIHAVSVATPGDRAFLLSSLNNGSGNLPKILDRIAHYGAIGHSHAMARRYTEQALASLNGLPGDEARAHLERLATYIANREY